MDKEKIRDRIKAQRKQLSKQEIEDKSAKITLALFSCDALKNANTVMVYLANFNEVRTDKITQRLFQKGKRVVAPITDEENISLTPYLFTNEKELTKGAYGIKEPKRDFRVEKSEIDAVIVPGIAFDENGNRMGFGKGYYDRFLEDFCGIKIGICYDFQIIDAIPTNEHDIAMDYIISEENIYVI